MRGKPSAQNQHNGAGVLSRLRWYSCRPLTITADFMHDNKPSLIRDPFVPWGDVAQELGGVSRTTLKQWVRDGYLPPSVKIGAQMGWPRSVLDAWKVEQGWPAPKPEPEVEPATTGGDE